MNLLTILLITSAMLGSSVNLIQAYDYVTEPFPSTTFVPVSTTPAVDRCKKDTEFNFQEAYNITQIIPLTIAEISKNVAKFYITINSKPIQISNYIVESHPQEVFTATLRSPSYYYRTYYGSESPTKLEVKNITCEFSNFLKINMTTESTLEVTGDYNITNNSTVPYVMRFAGIDVSIFKTYNPAGNTSSILTETDIEIEYKNFKIELSGNDGEELIAMNTMSSLIQEIKSYSKMLIKKGIILFFHSHSTQSTYDKIFTTCMQPKANIAEKFVNFTAHDLDHYYQIANEGRDQWSIVMDQIIIRGLTNFKNFSLNTESKELQLLIENVSGNANWYYYNESDLNVKPSRLNFKIDRIYVETDLKNVWQASPDPSSYNSYSSSYRELLLSSIIKIDAASVVCENLSDNLSSLASAILLEKIKSTIIVSITESLRSIQRSYEHENEFQQLIQNFSN